MSSGKFVRRALAGVLFAVCLASWLGLGASFLFDWPRSVKIVAAFAAAFSSEAAIWGGAALLGWTAFANRASILGRFRKAS